MEGGQQTDRHRALGRVDFDSYLTRPVRLLFPHLDLESWTIYALLVAMVLTIDETWLRAPGNRTPLPNSLFVSLSNAF